MSQEKDIRNKILVAASKAGLRLNINHVGQGWVGQVAPGRTDGRLTLLNPRPLTAGFGTGSSDLIGMTPILISPHHVGRTFAVFTAVEVKSGTGRLSKEQGHYIEMVKGWGGIACVARSAEDVADAVVVFKLTDGLVTSFGQILEAIEICNEKLGDWAGVDDPYAPGWTHPFRRIKSLLEGMVREKIDPSTTPTS